MTAVSIELKQTLISLSGTLTELVSLLRREHDLFIQPDIDLESLNALGSHKQTLLIQIDALEHARHQQLSVLNVDSSDLDACTRTCDALDCGPLWEEVCTQARQVKQMNGTSARVTEERYRINRELLAAMRLQRSGQLYGANGQAMQRRARRIMMAG